MKTECRCGYNGTGIHKCHRCGKAPGTRRFRHADVPYSLAGAQPKLNMVETYSCDECWAEWAEVCKITDAQIRELTRRHPEKLDQLMVAINSTDQELRYLAREDFAALLRKEGLA